MTEQSKFNIVVGVDFTQVGDHALDEALRYALRIDDDVLHPVFVVTKDRGNIEEIDEALEQAHTKLRERVIAHSEALGVEWEQEVVFHVRLGDPAKVLHQVAVDVNADVIIVGTHARRGLSKMILGSVADELTHHAHVPVLIARPNELSHLEKTDRPDDLRPGEDLHQNRRSSIEGLSFGRRNSHIAGLM